MVPEAELQQTDEGLVPSSDGWFVLNAKDARWYDAEGRPAVCDLEGEREFPQVGVNLFVLGPGEAMGMYHWEADQEDFLVLSGAPILLVEGEERQLRQWDFVHCPPHTNHIVVGAGDDACVVLAIGARDKSVAQDESWGGYTVHELALKPASRRRRTSPKRRTRT
jgi:uncharacterized cupin superfamily protein